MCHKCHICHTCHICHKCHAPPSPPQYNYFFLACVQLWNNTSSCQVGTRALYLYQGIQLPPAPYRIIGAAMFKRIFSTENLYAVLLCLLAILLLIMTADASPQWIYQGF
jgi:hypothetical protein